VTNGCAVQPSRQIDRAELFHQERPVPIGLAADIFLFQQRNTPEQVILNHREKAVEAVEKGIKAFFLLNGQFIQVPIRQGKQR
jgi:hypothetical protein